MKVILLPGDGIGAELAASGRLDAPNATNFVVQNGCAIDLSEHLSVVFDPRAGQIILNALDPAHKKALPCRPVLPGFGAPLG